MFSLIFICLLQLFTFNDLLGIIYILAILRVIILYAFLIYFYLLQLLLTTFKVLQLWEFSFLDEFPFFQNNYLFAIDDGFDSMCNCQYNSILR